MKKKEVISCLRALAIKYSDLGDHEKALSYLDRAQQKAEALLPSLEHSEYLQL